MEILKNILESLKEGVELVLEYVLDRIPLILVIVTPVCTLWAFWQAFKK
jgi:hypothetical protein